MNLRLTVAALVVFAALGGIVYYLESRGETKDDAKQPSVLTFAAGDVQWLAVESGGKTTELALQDNAWLIVKPEPGLADTWQVRNLIERLATLKGTRAIEVALATLADYDLATPTGRARLRLASGQTVELLIGGKTPDSASAYVKLPDTPTVYVVPSYVAEDVLRLASQPPKAQPTPTPFVPPTPTPGG
ncbi:MAG: DUF4340 domain-containing protein [Chloroflexi bacterium]|nr:DUF4340 domain-containing protein [Chloroflexota bacterium]